MDGLLAYLCVVALLAFLAWLHGGRQWRYLFLSAVMTGLALLSKSTTLILLPTAGLLLLIEGVRLLRHGERKAWKLLLAYGIWLLLAAVVVIGLWPALWVAPAKALATVLGGIRVHSAGHDSLNFFLGRPTDKPGPLFYPVAYLFRATPGALIGLIAAAVLTWRKRWPFDTPVRRRSAFGLTLFAVLFAAEMTLGAKMFDRYISPVFLALDVVAVLGLAGLVQLTLEWWTGVEHACAQETPDQRGVRAIRRMKPFTVPAGFARGRISQPALGSGARHRRVGGGFAFARSVRLQPPSLLFHLLQPAGRRQPHGSARPLRGLGRGPGRGRRLA